MPTNHEPPRARQIEHQTTLHGETLSDPFHWLRNRDDPEVLAYLEAENSYTQATMRSTAALQEQLYAELRGRIKEHDETAPVRRGEWEYFSRTETGQEYPVFVRRPPGGDQPEQVLLDQNALAEGHDFCRIGVFEASPDGRLLAYSVDYSGAEQFVLHVKDLATGELLADAIPNTDYSLAWASDNRSFLYTTLDAARRPFKVWRHVVDTPHEQDVLLHHEADDQFYASVERSRSGAWLFVTLESMDTSEVRFLSAGGAEGELQLVEPRHKGVEYGVEHHGERFLIRTNLEALNFRVVEAPVASPGRSNWSDILAHRPHVLVDGVDAFADYLVVYEREAGLKRIRISRPGGAEPYYVAFPEPAYTYTAGPNDDWDTDLLRFGYSSMVTPVSAVDWDMRAQRWLVRKQDEIPSGYDPGLYRSERITATSVDGVEVPMSLVYRPDQRRAGGNPALLYGYGSYGYSIDPGFNRNVLSLVDRGWVYAIAHIRGGSDLGRAWYDDGKLMNKRNTFSDFIACGEQMIDAGYAAPGKLAAMGASAGGLLMGAVANLRPELWAAMVAGVPFVDVVNTMSDPTLPLTVVEYDQWGNPGDPQAYAYIRSYSPYDNLEAKRYGHILATAGLNDPRVSYWEPAKWIARLRTLNTGDGMLLLKTELDSGHGGASGRFERLKEVAFEYAFLLKAVDDARIEN